MTTLLQIQVHGLTHIGSSYHQNYTVKLVKRKLDYTIQCWIGKKFKTCAYFTDELRARLGLRNYMKRAMKGEIFDKHAGQMEL